MLTQVMDCLYVFDDGTFIHKRGAVMTCTKDITTCSNPMCRIALECCEFEELDADLADETYSNEQTIESHQRQESRWLDRQNARDVNRKVS
jgi:hypothetical protein